MSEPLIFVETYSIRPGKLDEFKRAAETAVAFVKENEPRLLAYRISISDDGGTGVGFHIHPDSESMETHMEVASPQLGTLSALIENLSVDVLGSPSPRLLEILRQGAEMSGDITLNVVAPHAGFSRIQNC